MVRRRVRHVEEVELECQVVAFVHADAARVHGLERSRGTVSLRTVADPHQKSAT